MPNRDDQDFNTYENLSDLQPNERITIQGKCYNVRSLYEWIITGNNVELPETRNSINEKERQALINAYRILEQLPPQPSNILTREKLIELYPNLMNETVFDLRGRDYTGIAIGTFSNLPYIHRLDLNNNQISELQPGILKGFQELKLLLPGTYINVESYLSDESDE